MKHSGMILLVATTAMFAQTRPAIELPAEIGTNAANSAPAAGQEEFRTGGSFNGRAWKSYGSSQKVAFVMGFVEGLIAADTSAEKFEAHSTPSLQFGEVTAGIDQFYEKAENATLPIFIAIRVFNMKVSGLDPALIERRLASFHRLFLSGLSAQAVNHTLFVK